MIAGGHRSFAGLELYRIGNVVRARHIFLMKVFSIIFYLGGIFAITQYFVCCLQLRFSTMYGSRLALWCCPLERRLSKKDTPMYNNWQIQFLTICIRLLNCLRLLITSCVLQLLLFFAQNENKIQTKWKHFCWFGFCWCGLLNVISWQPFIDSVVFEPFYSALWCRSSTA